MQQQMMQALRLGGAERGFGDSGRGFGSDSLTSSMGGMGGMGGGSSYSSMSFYSSSSSNGGEPVVIQRSSSHVVGPGGISESKQTYRDSRDGGSAGMRLARGIGDRRRIVQQERGSDGVIKEETRHVNVEEADRATFDEVWRDRARRSGFRGSGGSALLRAGNSTSSGQRYLDGHSGRRVQSIRDRLGRGSDGGRYGRRSARRAYEDDEMYGNDDAHEAGAYDDDEDPYDTMPPAREPRTQRREPKDRRSLRKSIESEGEL